MGPAESELSIRRKILIKLCTVSCGRPSELGWLMWSTMEWNPHFKVAVAQLPQSKVSKVKRVNPGSFLRTLI
jgi:hypothetical protein